MQLLDGKFISNKIKEEIREEVEALKKNGERPVVAALPKAVAEASTDPPVPPSKLVVAVTTPLLVWSTPI